MEEYASSALKGLARSFELMTKELNQSLMDTEQLKDLCSGLIDRVQKGCEKASESVEKETFLLINQIIEKMNLGLKDLNQMSPDNSHNNHLMGHTSAHSWEAPFQLSSQHKIKNTKLVVNQVNDCLNQRVIGGNDTVISLQNQNSYLIGTRKKGFILVKNGIQLYFNNIPQSEESITDTVYVPSLDCYIMNCNCMLFRKNIDDQPASFFMGVNGGYRPGACLRYSNLHQRLIVSKDCEAISVIDPMNQIIEIEVQKSIGDQIRDFKIVGLEEDMVISVTGDGHLLLYKLDYGQKTGSVVSHYEIELFKERSEEAKSIAVCNKNQCVLVEIAEWMNPFSCSRMLVFQIVEDALVEKACLDPYNQKIGFKYALECFGYAGSHILWVGLSHKENGVLQVYDYDLEAESLKELSEKRVKHLENNPFLLNRLNGKIYYTGRNGTLMGLEVSNN